MILYLNVLLLKYIFLLVLVFRYFLKIVIFVFLDFGFCVGVILVIFGF